MEGVLVSAKKAGSTITITVVSDKDGRYSFPASKLEPGQYALRIRAVGYDLDNAKSDRSRGAEDHHARSQAPQDRGPRGAAVERRMDGEHAGQRSAQGRAPQLRRLPHARARHALDAQRRRLSEDHAAAHAGLRQPEHPAAPAAAQGRAADGGARRSARAGLRADGGLPRHHQSQREAAVELPARPDAAAGRPRHARDLHRIRPAARHHRAARRHRR